jgi:hypothetical protein
VAYRAIARAGSVYLTRAEPGATVYGRAGFGAGDFLPGLSDIDLVVVLPRGRAGERVSQRWQRLRRKLPASEFLLDWPRVYEEEELAQLAGSTAFTYDLDSRRHPSAAYCHDDAIQSRARMLERPGLYGATSGWELLHGRERRPPERVRDPQLRRIAAWLELVSWWQWVPGVCVNPSGPRSAHLCLKLVAESARIWLWLTHGERAGDRRDALCRALRRLPEEEDALRGALELQAALPDSPPAPLAETLPVLVRMSSRIAGVIGSQVRAEGVTEVALAGADPGELVLPRGGWKGAQAPPLGALSDWRSLVLPDLPDEAFGLLSADPANPDVLAAAVITQGLGPYPAFRTDDLLLLLGFPRWRGRLRAVQCAATDPVSFALTAGEPVARFPQVPGWSAQDVATRAVAEHRARLPLHAEASGGRAAGRALGQLLTAARAALFLESLEAGEPELAVTVSGTARRLAERSASARTLAEASLGAYRAFAQDRTDPSSDMIAALRRLVLELPAFAGRE